VNELGESQRRLLEAYQSWHDLTLRETAALQVNDWARVTECQSAKSDLQFRIVGLTEAAQRETELSGASFPAFTLQLRTLLTKLIASEKSNCERIQQKRTSTESKKRELDCQQGMLGKVHRTPSRSIHPIKS
jgi:hypothetical protein